MAYGHITIDSFELLSYIQERHVYKEVWIPYVGEGLVVNGITGNRHDEFAI